MKKSVVCAALTLAAVGYGIPAGAQEMLVRFQGGIGVIPVSNVATTGTTAADQVVTVTPNTVRGVVPAGQIWVIEKLDAKVRTDGSITVKGEGLIFGGGNNIGRATGQNVFATLICETANFVERSTDAAGVTLAANGDFRIEGQLQPAPQGCASPVLLIRNAAGTRGWFAAGILSTDD